MQDYSKAVDQKADGWRQTGEAASFENPLPKSRQSLSWNRSSDKHPLSTSDRALKLALVTGSGVLMIGLVTWGVLSIF